MLACMQSYGNCSTVPASRPILAPRLRPLQHRRSVVPLLSRVCSSSSTHCWRGSSSGSSSVLRPAARSSCCIASHSSCSSSAAGSHASSSRCQTPRHRQPSCPGSPGSNSSSRHGLDLRTAAAAAAAACPTPDTPGPHIQQQQRPPRRRSSSSVADQADLAQQHDQAFAGSDFLGLGFRHSVEEAFKAFVHVPSSAGSSSSSSSSDQQQHTGQHHWQQHQQQHQVTSIAEHIRISSYYDSSSSSTGADVAAAVTSAAGAGKAAHALTRQIQGCKTAADLELLLQQHWRQLDHIHVAAAYVQLVRVQRSSSGSAHTNPSNPGNSTASSSAGSRAGLSNPGGSSSSSRDLMSPAGMQWLQQLAAHHLPQLQSRHISNILWACASLNLKPPQPWLQALTDKAQTLFYKGTTPQGFANIIWAVAVSKVQVQTQWIADFLAASQPHLFNFQPQELSSTIWALATMAVQIPASWQYSYATASTAKMGSCNAQGLSNQLWAVAKLGLVMPEPWTAAITYACQIRSQQFTPLGLSNLLWGAAKITGKFQQQQQYLTAAAEWPQPQQQQQQQQQQGLAISGSSSGTQWIQPLLVAAAARLQQYNAHTLSNVVWSLAVLDHRSDHAFLDQCLQQVLSKVNQLSAAAAAAALWGFSQLGVIPGPQQMAPLLLQMHQLLPQCNAQQLIYIASALALYKQQQQHVSDQVGSSSSEQQLVSEAFLHQYLSVCSQQLQQQKFGPGQMCQLGRWLAAAAVQPESQWTDSYLLHLAQQLPRLNPSHHVLVLKTLASWGVKPHDGWSAMFLAAVAAEPRVSKYTVGHIGVLLQGFAAAALEPQQQQLEIMLQQVVTASAHITAGSTAAVLQGLCGLGFRPSKQWLQRFWDVGSAGLSGSDAAGVTALAEVLQLPQLGQLQIRPSKLWGLAYCAAVAAVLNPSSSSSSSSGAAAPGLDPHQAAAVLTALAAVQRGQPDQEQQLLLLDLMSAAAAGDRLQQLDLQELVGCWWALVELGALDQPLPLNLIQQQQQDLDQSQDYLQQQQQDQQQPPVQHALEVPLTYEQQQLVTVQHWQRQQQQQQPFAQQPMQQQRPDQMSTIDCQTQQEPAFLQQQQQCDVQQWHIHLLQHLFSMPEAVGSQMQLSKRSLLQLSSALGRVQQLTPSSWADSYAAAVSACVPQLAPHQLVSVLCAMPLLGRQTMQRHLTDRLLVALQPDLVELSAKQLSEVIVAAQQIGVRPSESWLSDFVAATTSRLPRFLGRQIIRVLASLARLRFTPASDFLTAAADLAVEKSGSGVAPAYLVDLIWALTALRVSPAASWMARFEARMLEKGPDRLDAVGISRFAWCLGALQRKPGQLLMAKWLIAAQAQHCNMDARSLADTIWACAMLDEKPNKQWLDSFITHSRDQLFSFPTNALLTVLWALALLQHRPPSDWMHRCLAAVTAVLSSSMGAATTATAAAAPRSAGSSSSVQLLQRPQLPGMAAAAGKVVAANLAALTPSQITNLIWSLAALDCQLPQQLMQLLTWHAESVISAVDSDDLAQLVWALDRLDDTQEKIWVRRFAVIARAQLLTATGGGLAHNVGQGLRALPQQGLGSTAAADLAAVGFRQLHGVSGMGQVVMIRPSRAAAAAGQQQQQGSASSAAAAGSSTAVPVVARGAAVASIAEGIKRTKISKQELYAKLMQLQQHQSQ